MHTLHSIAAILGLMLMTCACSSESDEAQPLPISKTGSDAAFSYYEKSGDGFVDAQELYKGEQSFGATGVTSKEIAEQILADYDFDGNGLDNLEFTGLVHAKVLSGILHHPEWAAPSGK
jgi:hypothetical protein